MLAAAAHSSLTSSLLTVTLVWGFMWVGGGIDMARLQETVSKKYLTYSFSVTFNNKKSVSEFERVKMLSWFYKCVLYSFCFFRLAVGEAVRPCVR